MFAPAILNRSDASDCGIRSLVDDDIAEHGAEQAAVARRNAARLDQHVPPDRRLPARHVDARRERRSQRHRPAAAARRRRRRPVGAPRPRGRRHGGTRPHAAQDAAAAAVGRSLRRRRATGGGGGVAARVVVAAVAVDVHVDGQLVEVVDVVLVPGSTVCQQNESAFSFLPGADLGGGG